MTPIRALVSLCAASWTARFAQAMQIALHGHGAGSYEVIGGRRILRPSPRRHDELSAGEVGLYFRLRSRSVSETKVGDTITDADNPAAEAAARLSNRRSRWCSAASIPQIGADYESLRDRAGKAAVSNDASLSYEPETSMALGFGFRCGFLGLLHMEIIQERLEREFDLDLVTTAPSVIYKVKKTDGTELTVDNPSNLPDPSEIQSHGRADGRSGIS